MGILLNEEASSHSSGQREKWPYGLLVVGKDGGFKRMFGRTNAFAVVRIVVEFNRLWIDFMPDAFNAGRPSAVGYQTFDSNV